MVQAASPAWHPPVGGLGGRGVSRRRGGVVAATVTVLTGRVVAGRAVVGGIRVGWSVGMGGEVMGGK